MKVNTNKTKLMCVSDALSFLLGSYIERLQGVGTGSAVGARKIL